MYYKSGRNKGLVSDPLVIRSVTSRLARRFKGFEAPDAPAHDLGSIRTPKGRKRLIACHAVDLVVVADTGAGRVLLITRRNPPGRGLLAIPGGFVEQGEALGDAALREAEEETGIATGAATELDIAGKDLRALMQPVGPWRVTRAFDIRGTDGWRGPRSLCTDLTLMPGDLMAVTTQPFALILPRLAKSMIRAGDDAAGAGIYALDEVGKRDLGIADHHSIIQDARRLLA